jgi:hypothetical protein
MAKCNQAARVLLKELELALEGLQEMQREVERMGAGGNTVGEVAFTLKALLEGGSAEKHSIGYKKNRRGEGGGEEDEEDEEEALNVGGQRFFQLETVGCEEMLDTDVVMSKIYDSAGVVLDVTYFDDR